MSKVYGFTRVSTDKQTTDNQKHMILEYAHHNKLTIDKIIETTVSSRKTREQREIDSLIEMLKDKDTLLVYSLDRIGRSTLDTLQIIEDIKNLGVKIILIKENITIDKHNTNAMNEMMLTMLSAFAQLERSFISERTKAGLARAKEQGKVGGRKKGQQVKSIFDEHLETIKTALQYGATNKAIHVAIGEVGTVQSLGKYIKTRALKEIAIQNSVSIKESKVLKNSKS